NDVLVDGRKICGILVETLWLDGRAQAIILGVGVNVLAESVPPAEELQFPATSVEDSLGQPVGRAALLRSILTHIFAWRERMLEQGFWNAWQDSLAFRGQWVRVEGGQQPIVGALEGLNADGNLLLRLEDGSSAVVMVGDVHLRTFLDGR
nr:hypothetical protein [Longilinea sp.]